MTTEPPWPPATFLKSRTAGVLKWTAVALVLAFVGWRFAALVEDSDGEWPTIRFAWLLPAGAAYLAGMLIAAGYWAYLLSVLGSPIRTRPAVAAHLCGQLGKYIPGKAGVLLIRGGLAKSAGGFFGVAVFAAAVETLFMMGIGLVVGLAGLPLLFEAERLPEWAASLRWVFDSPTLWTGGVLVALFAALPVLSVVTNKVARKIIPADAEPLRPVGVSTRMLAVGVLLGLLMWTCLGASTLCLLEGTAADGDAVPGLVKATVATALSHSLGFLAIFVPGGIGVREMFLVESLTLGAAVASERAIAVAVGMRILWLVVEVAAAAAAYLAVTIREPTSEPGEPTA